MKNQEKILVDQYKNQIQVDRKTDLQDVIQVKFFENRVAISVIEVAVTLGVSTRTVERMIQRGELKAIKVGRRTLISKQELGAWLNRKG